MDKNQERDLKFMKLAIVWAGGCQPIKKSIPKVGAIIAVGDVAIGRGRRDTGEVGDDDHAEVNALKKVEDKSLLTKATLYTTLEPCTIHVRSNPLDCCTEQILQHKINRVFVGILDPNQGVTGKGLLRLQDAGVDVVLFPHELSQQIRVQNRDFILSQQSLTATILAPKNTRGTTDWYALRFASNPLTLPEPTRICLSRKQDCTGHNRVIFAR